MNKFPLTVDQFKDLHIKQGKSISEIAKLNSIKVSWVSTWCKRNGILLNTFATSSSSITKEMIKDACDSGLSSRQIANKFGVSKTLIGQKLIEYNLQTKNPSLHEIGAQRIDKLIDNQLADDDIASKLGCSVSTVRRIRSSINVKYGVKDISSRNMGRDISKTIKSEFNISKNIISLDTLTYGSSYKADWTCSNCGNKWAATIKDRTRLDRPSGCPKCAGQQSLDEDYICDFISQFGYVVERNIKGLLDNPALELDIYVPSIRLAIETCGQQFHSEQKLKKRGMQNQHYVKYLQAHSADIRLLTIFDSELHNRANAIEGYLLAILNKVSNVIYARQCQIINVPQSTMELFLDTNHIQGKRKVNINIGLEYNGKLVAVMSFANRSTTLAELTRFCLPTNLSVPGAASKLLKYFTRNYKQYKEIISFSDNRFSQGNLYNKIGFKKVHDVAPSYYYFKSGRRELVHKSKFKKDHIETILGPILPDETEHQAMLRFGYNWIWDCGKIKWSMKV